MRWMTFATAGIAAAAALVYFTGCETEPATDVQRNVSIDFTGVYQGIGATAATSNSGAQAGRVVANNTGNPITFLNLIQNGDRLEAVDNNSRVWKGSLGEVIGSRGSFTLEGETSVGNRGLMSGSLVESGNGAQMRGTYTEDVLFSTIEANAAVINGRLDSGNTNPTNSGTNSASFQALPGSATLDAARRLDLLRRMVLPSLALVR
jgi:hypothetical protein